MDINQVQELIRMVSKAKLTEFILKDGDFKLIIRNQGSADGSSKKSAVAPAPQPVVQPPAPAPAPPAPPAAAAPATPAAPAAEDSSSNLLTIKSPMVGTFYRSSAPDKPPFIKVGDSVENGTTVCIIEAMKLFNEIESDNISGTIVKVLVDDASPVEYDQPLFMVDPS